MPGYALLAQIPELETPDLPDLSDLRAADEGPGPLTRLLQDQFGEDNLAVDVLVPIIEAGLRILLIIVLAALAVGLVKRGIWRTVERAKDPSQPRARRLREKVGLLQEGTAVTSMRRTQRADALGALVSSVAGAIIWLIAVFMVLAVFNINLGPLIAGAGILGIALGFGAQDLVKDFISGVFMLAEDQYGVGDIVDAGEAVGVVEGVTLRSTRIRDVEGTLWHVPNGEIRRIGNMSQEWARALLDVAVAYGTDIDAASELIRRVASEMAHEDDYRDTFLAEPDIWGVQNLGNDSVDIRLVIKTRPGEQWGIARELRRRLKNAFDVAEVEIPFPQRTVWLRTEKAVSVGDADAAAFDHPVPDEQAMRRAVEASKRGDTGAKSELHDLLPDDADGAAEPGDAEDA